jgi:hypothetical protein
MPTLPIEVPEALAARLPKEEVNRYAVAALNDLAERTEVPPLSETPGRPLAESFAAARAKFGLPEPTLSTAEERARRAATALAKIDREKIAQAEREGLL